MTSKKAFQLHEMRSPRPRPMPSDSDFFVNPKNVQIVSLKITLVFNELSGNR